MPRNVILSIIFMTFIAGSAFAQDSDTTNLDCHMIQWTLGMGAVIPAFDTDDNVKAGASINLDLAYHFSRRSNFGLLGRVHVAYNPSGKERALLERSSIIAIGDETFDRFFSYMHFGVEWTRGTPYTNRVRPRFAMTLGPCYTTTDRDFQVAGFCEADDLSLERNKSTSFSTMFSAGAVYDFKDRKHGFSINGVAMHIWDADFYFPDGARKENVWSFGIVLGWHINTRWNWFDGK